jgi:hypothetical protein
MYTVPLQEHVKSERYGDLSKDNTVEFSQERVCDIND